MTRPPLPYGRQCIEDDDIAAVTEVLKSDFLTTGPAVKAFETELSSVLRSNFAVACSSGTAALHLASRALGLKEGDTVVVPAITFVATANVVRLLGAEVLFADVDPGSGLITTDTLGAALERANGPVRAVIPVHLNGQSADMQSIAHTARPLGLKIIEDAAHAFGTATTNHDGLTTPTGAAEFSDLVCFSFHPVKTIAMGEGGAVTGKDRDLQDRLLRLRNHGLTKDIDRFEYLECALDKHDRPNPWYYEMPEIGFNYRASDINCALGSSQLAKLDRLSQKRNQLVSIYDSYLSEIGPAIKPIARAGRCRPVWHLYAVHIDFDNIGKSRSQVMNELNDHGVGTQVHYIPVNQQPYYMHRYGPLHLPGAQHYYQQCLSLPLYPLMTKGDAVYVVTTLKEVLGL